MENIIGIHGKKNFTLDEARALLPVIQRITRFANKEVQQIQLQFSHVSDEMRRGELERRVQKLFGEWNEKIRKLGAEAKGMWLVDFDNGEGYYCWHFPEPDIGFFHGYTEGFRGRVRVH